MTEQETQLELPLIERLIIVLVNSFVPFSLGVFFASAIFLYGYMDFAQIISTAITKSCAVPLVGAFLSAGIVQ